MNALLVATFVATSVVLIVVPGPNVMVIVSTSFAHGAKRGLLTVLGTSSAMIIQLLIAAFSTAWLVESITEGFVWLKWFGVAYLIFLGMSHLTKLYNKNDYIQISSCSSFARGFFVSLTNPKTILFFSAFLPQFVSPGGDYKTQILVLSCIFLMLATFFDGLYALLSGYASGLIQGQRAIKVQHGVSGILFIVLGAWLATLRKA